MSSTDLVSIIIPTYNEADNISLLVRRLRETVLEEHEIVVVDDGSPDGTASVVEGLQDSLPNLHLVKRGSKKGLASAVVDGVKAARGGVVVVMDADLSHPPEKVAGLIAALQDSDIAVGSRSVKGGGVQSWPFHRKMISKGAEMLARLLLGIRCTDPLSGFFAIRRSVFMQTRFRVKGYKILLNILADNPSARVMDVPYIFRDRHAGQTKLGYTEILRYVLDLFRLRSG